MLFNGTYNLNSAEPCIILELKWRFNRNKTYLDIYQSNNDQTSKKAKGQQAKALLFSK